MVRLLGIFPLFPAEVTKDHENTGHVRSVFGPQ